jgi:hypothetical protein
MFSTAMSSISESDTKTQAVESPSEVATVDATDKKQFPFIYSQNDYNNGRSDLIGSEVCIQRIDDILEREKQNNKSDAWNKLDKCAKIQHLHAFAERYGTANNLSIHDIKSLKLFFVNCLDKNKLQKTKDLSYNKETREVVSIPALCFNNTTNAFTLKITDTKRVSTMKSLTPKRVTAKNIDV